MDSYSTQSIIKTGAGILFLVAVLVFIGELRN